MEFVSLTAKEVAGQPASFIAPPDKENSPEVEGFLREMIGEVEKAAFADVPTLALEGGTPPPRGTQQLMQLYSQSPWLRAIVNKIGKAVAATQWQVFLMDTAKEATLRYKNLDFDNRQQLFAKGMSTAGLEQIQKHPILDLLDYGNEQLGGDGVMQLASTYNDLVGEVMLLMERDGLGMPVQLWPIPPFWIQELPTKSKPFFKLQPKGGAQLLVPITEVIWLKDPDPAEPYGRGSGIAKSLGDEIEIDEYSAKHMKSFFYNRARPDIIVSGDNISPEDAKRLEQKWLQNHQGFWKAFKPLFFSRKVDIKELTQNFENIQMVNVREHERNTFIQVFGCHDDQTECLTKDGWISYDKLTTDHEVATYNKNFDRMEFQKPSDIHIYDCDSPIHYWGGGEKSKFDVAVTMDHRMWVGTKLGSGDYRWRFETSGACEETPRQYRWLLSAPYEPDVPITLVDVPFIQNKGGKQKECPEAGYYQIESSVMSEFLGYWLSEGGLEDSPSRAIDIGKYGIRLHQNSGPLSDAIGESLASLNMGDVVLYERPGTKEQTHRMSSKSLFMWLKENTGLSCKDKHIPEMVFDFPVSDRENLLRCLMDTDGDTNNRFNDRSLYTGQCYYSSSERLVDDVQRLALSLGYRSTVCKPTKNGIFRVSISSMENSRFVHAEVKKPHVLTTKHYKGKVWCVTVPNGLFFTRRNGKVSCHGNCPPEKFGIVNESKRSTIAAADYFFTKDVVQPRIEFIRKGLQRELVPLFGDNLLLHYDSPVIQDKEFKLDVMRRAPWAYSLNDWRELSGHSNMGDDGEIVLLPLNHTFVPIDQLSEGGAIIGTGDEPAEVESEEEEGEEDEETSESGPVSDEEEGPAGSKSNELLDDARTHFKSALAGSVRVRVAELARRKLLAHKVNEKIVSPPAD